MPNHAEGLVEGLSVPQGNRLLHRDLRAALPQIALSGGLDEAPCPTGAFAQRHAPTLSTTSATLQTTRSRLGHPRPFLFHATIYGYPDDTRNGAPTTPGNVLTRTGV